MCVRLVLAALVAALFSVPAQAQTDKADIQAHSTQQAFAVGPVMRSSVSPRNRLAIYAYFRGEFLAGLCPAGLTRKSTGCRPADDTRRQWSVGKPLHPLVMVFSLPQALLWQLPPAPRGHRLARVDSDIVLIETETRRVTESVASIADLQDPNWPIIGEDDRMAVVSYFRNDHANRTCPSDLRPTRRGCEPRPLWTLGEPLDPLLTYELLPERLQAQLGPVPDGYRYIRIADHVLLMVTATRIIRAEVLDLADLNAGSAASR